MVTRMRPPPEAMAAVGAGRLAQRGQVLLQALHVLHGRAVLHVAPVGQAVHAQALRPALGRLPQSWPLSAVMLG